MDTITLTRTDILHAIAGLTDAARRGIYRYGLCLVYCQALAALDADPTATEVYVDAAIWRGILAETRAVIATAPAR